LTEVEDDDAADAALRSAAALATQRQPANGVLVERDRRAERATACRTREAPQLRLRGGAVTVRRLREDERSGGAPCGHEAGGAACDEQCAHEREQQAESLVTHVFSSFEQHFVLEGIEAFGRPLSPVRGRSSPGSADQDAL